MRRAIVGLGAAAAVVGLSVVAQAATKTTTFTVSLTITADCTVSAANLTFPSSGVLSANVDQTSNVSVTCTNTTPYNVGLDKGVNGANVTSRLLNAGGAENVSYALYRDAGRSQNWGETIGTDTVSDTGNGSAKTHTVYGRVPTQTSPSPGTYTDTITVTVTF